MIGAGYCLAIARELDDPALLARTLTACCVIAGLRYNAEAARTHYSEASVFARKLDDRWSLSPILAWRTNTGIAVGDPIAARAAGEEGRDLADAIGDRPNSRMCQVCLAWVQLMEGDVDGAIAGFRGVIAECDADHDEFLKPISRMGLSIALAHGGEVDAARVVADAALETPSGLVWQHLSVAQPQMAAMQRAFNPVEVALADGDLVLARRLADAAVSVGTGWHLATALVAHARVAIADGEQEEAERDAHDALVCAASCGAYQPLAGILECLADLAGDTDNQQAARLFGAAAAVRHRAGAVRFKIHQAGYEASVAALRAAMGERTLTPLGPRAQRCPLRRRSPTRAARPR
jgi:hypothetical protein